MSGSLIEAWLARKQRKALFSAWFYFAGAFFGGILALLPNLGIAFLIGKIFLLVTFPIAANSGIWAAILTMPIIAWLFVDCIRAEREDMAVIPLWLAREYFHMGPRLMLDGWHAVTSARRLSRVDAATCAEVLGYLAAKTTPTSRLELERVFPWVIWDEIVAQLRVVEGVILFRNVNSVSLLAPLRMELRRLLAQAPGAEIPREEPEAVPVEEPQQLSPHEILGVSASASTAEIKTAYRNRVKECHPDRFHNLDVKSRELAEEWTKSLNAAYAELLSGARSR